MTCGDMIPFNPFDMHVVWYRSWRGHVANIKTFPEEADIYGKAACIANAMYVMELAFKINQLKKAGIINRDEHGSR